MTSKNTISKIRAVPKGLLLLWQSSFVSTFGDAVYYIALGFFILKKTDSTVLMGMVEAVAALPSLVVSPFAGVLLDSLDRKRVLVLMDFARGALMTALSVLAFSNLLNIPEIFAASVLLGIGGSVFRPGVNASIPDIAAQMDLSRVNSFLSIASMGSNALGNVLGGFLFELLGAPVLFLFNGISYFISGLLIGFVHSPANGNMRILSAENYFSDLKEGFRFTWEQRGLRQLLSLAAVINFFVALATVLFLPLFERSSSLGAGKYGFVMAFYMIGTALGYIVFSFISIKLEKKTAAFLISAFVSCASLLIGINQRIFMLMPPLFLLGGFFNSIINIIFISTVQENSPAGMRGKTMAFVNMTTQGLTPFALALGGAAAQYVTVGAVISASLAVSVVSVVPFCFLKPFSSYLNRCKASGMRVAEEGDADLAPLFDSNKEKNSGQGYGLTGKNRP